MNMNMNIEEDLATPILDMRSPLPINQDESESKDELNPLDNIQVLSIGRREPITNLTDGSVEAALQPKGLSSNGTFADLSMPSKTLFKQAERELSGNYPPNSNKVSKMLRLKKHIIRPKNVPMKSH